MVCRHLNFDDLAPSAVDSDDVKEEENFPQHPWMTQYGLRKSITERDLCIHMALRKPETSYPSQIPTQPQELIYESATLEEPMDSMISDMPNLIIDIPEEVLFQNCIYTHLGCELT